MSSTLKALVAGLVGAALFHLVLNVPAAYAQAMAPGSATVDVLAALVGKDVAAARYTATATTGSGFSCNSNLASCLKLPGADFTLGSDGTQWLLGPAGSTTVRLKIGANLRFTGDGEALVNGPLDQYNGGYFKNAIGGPVLVDDAEGLRIAGKTLGTCGVDTPEGSTLVDGAAGGTTGARTRECLCTSDGGVTPAYVWQNKASGNTGTATTCPP